MNASTAGAAAAAAIAASTAANTPTQPNALASSSLPNPVLQALAAKASSDPALRALVHRILSNSATLSDNFRFLLLVNETTLEELQRSQLATMRAITEGELRSFHEAHFGHGAIAAFVQDFLSPNESEQTANHVEWDGEYYEEEDDGLGYYPDGVKRTLTDEQIAMFRHSELQELEKAKEKRQSSTRHRRNTSSPTPPILDEGKGSEDGEVGENLGVPFTPLPTKKKNKKKKKKRGSGNSNKKQWEPDPERRKRTWDVVETGLDELAYDDSEQSGGAAEPAPQRRRITYEEG